MPCISRGLGLFRKQLCRKGLGVLVDKLNIKLQDPGK